VLYKSQGYRKKLRKLGERSVRMKKLEIVSVKFQGVKKAKMLPPPKNNGRMLS